MSAVGERPRSLWRNPDFLLLWGSQGISTIGTQASQLALPLLMLAMTRSPAQAGLLGGLRGLAYIAFGLPAGALIDRWNRRRVMVCCDLGRALAFASIPLAMIAGHLTVVQLYAVGFVEGTLYSFFGLAEIACLTRVVPPAQLPTAIAQNQATDATSTLIGPPLGGALFGIARALPFAADAASYIVSVLAILLIRTPLQPERGAGRRAFRSDIGDAIGWIRRRRPLPLLLFLDGGTYLVFGGWTLALIELAQRLGASAATIGLIFACGGAGTILGALLTPLVQRWLSLRQIVVGIAWIFAITWPPYALAPNVLTLGIINAIGFICVPMTFATQISYRLLIVPDALQSRVNSIFFLAAFGCQALGLLLIGVLLQWFGPIATVWITFVPALGLAVLPTLSAPLRGVGRLATVSARPS